ncbi:MAG TPA: hypothetical protein PLF54_05140 [Deltaproteobacteria bacterium]|nr:hypothetical protein [Deltaproteobacteria bacterium]
MFLTTLLYAQPELTYLYGKLKSPDAHDRASINQLEYLQELPRPFAFSLSYLNEGHLDDPEMHHRDGFAFQIWARKPVFVPWFSLAAGVGPYYWYDTQRDSAGSDDYVRGFGIMSSAAAKIRLPYGGLFLQGRFNWVEAFNNIDTTSFLVGVGTDFSSAEVLDKVLPEVSEDQKNEFLIHLESFTESSVKGIEYRRNLGILGGHVEAGATYFFTGRTVLEEYRSYGAAAQLWAVNVYRERLKFGFGIGLFLDMTDSPYDASGIASYLIALRISNHWNLRYTHSRIIPNHDLDEDIRTIAVGYLF